MVAERIKQLRLENKMTQKDLADRLYVTAQAVSRWENGEVEPSVTTVAKLSEIFNVSTDEILGVKTPEPSVIIQKEYVVGESKPVLAVCEKCNKPIYESTNIIKTTVKKRHGPRTTETQIVMCRDCYRIKQAEEKRVEEEKRRAMHRADRKRLTHSYVWSTLFLILMVGIGIAEKKILMFSLIGIDGFLLISCLILNNNFIGEMILTISSWGFLKLPGLIFSLDLDGIIWLITVKLVFFAISFTFFLGCLSLALALGGALAIFVYPFALSKFYQHLNQYTN